MLSLRAPRLRPSHPRGAAIYSVVIGVSLLVTVLSLASLKVVRLERRTATASTEAIAARLNAQAAVEMALRDVQKDTSWRTRYQHGLETSTVPLGAGTASWKLLDTTDSNLNDDPWDGVEIKGIGRVGDAVWVESATLQAVGREIGPLEVASYTSSTSPSTETVRNNVGWAQYFKPSLPSLAKLWRVTNVQIYCRTTLSSSSWNKTVSFKLQPPTSSSDWKPAGTVYDETVHTASLLPTSFRWYQIPFTTNANLDPAQPLCLTLTSSTNDIIDYQYLASLSFSNSAVIKGTPAWGTVYTDRSMLYRVFGMYTVVDMKLVPGKWKRTTL